MLGRIVIAKHHNPVARDLRESTRIRPRTLPLVNGAHGFLAFGSHPLRRDFMVSCSIFDFLGQTFAVQGFYAVVARTA